MTSSLKHPIVACPFRSEETFKWFVEQHKKSDYLVVVDATTSGEFSQRLFAHFKMDFGLWLRTLRPGAARGWHEVLFDAINAKREGVERPDFQLSVAFLERLEFLPAFPTKHDPRPALKAAAEKSSSVAHVPREIFQWMGYLCDCPVIVIIDDPFVETSIAPIYVKSCNIEFVNFIPRLSQTLV